MPPSITADSQVLERHQGRFDSSNICVLGDPDHDWNPTRSAADLVETAQKMLLADAVGDGTLEAAEADMAEPISRLVSRRVDRLVIVPEEALVDELPDQGGMFRLLEEREPQVFLSELKTSDGRVIFQDADFSLATPKDEARVIRGSWAGIELTAGISGVEEIRAAATDLAMKILRVQTRKTTTVGVTFMEQAPTRDQMQRAWVFFEFERSGDHVVLAGNGAIGTQAWSRRVRQLRVPELAGIESKKVAIIGAGSLGGEIAVGLAKAGVGRISILDSDTYDLNNAVRHVVPYFQAGKGKAASVAVLAASMNPFVEVKDFSWDVGSTEEHREKFMEVVGGSDLVVDATGSESVSRFAHDVCVRFSLPLIVSNLSRGAWGGRIIRLNHRTPCYDCFIQSLSEGLIEDVPVEPERPGVTPYGCSHPAASGAGFDVSELASLVTRRVVQELGLDGYPPNDADWILVSFRDTAPSGRHREGELASAENCPICETPKA